MDMNEMPVINQLITTVLNINEFIDIYFNTLSVVQKRLYNKLFGGISCWNFVISKTFAIFAIYNIMGSFPLKETSCQRVQSGGSLLSKALKR